MTALHDRKTRLAVILSINLLPVMGVLFLHWSLFQILFFYIIDANLFGLYLLGKLILNRHPGGLKGKAARIVGYVLIAGFCLCVADFLGLAFLLAAFKPDAGMLQSFSNLAWFVPLVIAGYVIELARYAAQGGAASEHPDAVFLSAGVRMFALCGIIVAGMNAIVLLKGVHPEYVLIPAFVLFKTVTDCVAAFINITKIMERSGGGKPAPQD